MVSCEIGRIIKEVTRLAVKDFAQGVDCGSIDSPCLVVVDPGHRVCLETGHSGDFRDLKGSVRAPFRHQNVQSEFYHIGVLRAWSERFSLVSAQLNFMPI